MIVATWKFNGIFKGDAQKVAEEIKGIGEDVSPRQIVDRAKDESSELHKCFEWDDSIAADRYRLQQARQIVCSLVIKEDTPAEDRPPIRIFHKTEAHEGYKPVVRIVKQEDEYKALLERAWAELKAFKAKYSMLSELQEILSLID